MELLGKMTLVVTLNFVERKNGVRAGLLSRRGSSSVCVTVPHLTKGAAGLASLILTCATETGESVGVVSSARTNPNLKAGSMESTQGNATGAREAAGGKCVGGSLGSLGDLGLDDLLLGGDDDFRDRALDGGVHMRGRLTAAGGARGRLHTGREMLLLPAVAGVSVYVVGRARRPRLGKGRHRDCKSRMIKGVFRDRNVCTQTRGDRNCQMRAQGEWSADLELCAFVTVASQLRNNNRQDIEKAYDSSSDAPVVQELVDGGRVELMPTERNTAGWNLDDGGHASLFSRGRKGGGGPTIAKPRQRPPLEPTELQNVRLSNHKLWTPKYNQLDMRYAHVIHDDTEADASALILAPMRSAESAKTPGGNIAWDGAEWVKMPDNEFNIRLEGNVRRTDVFAPKMQKARSTGQSGRDRHSVNTCKKIIAITAQTDTTGIRNPWSLGSHLDEILEINPGEASAFQAICGTKGPGPGLHKLSDSRWRLRKDNATCRQPINRKASSSATGPLESFALKRGPTER
ncbi:hypothetical protein FB451DRAFT_1166619 [Mycena latifolia]|nr:hypothetical protein FB451DRAFT_1166619 [Mycena latifolia]